MLRRDAALLESVAEAQQIESRATFGPGIATIILTAAEKSAAALDPDPSILVTENITRPMPVPDGHIAPICLTRVGSAEMVM